MVRNFYNNLFLIKLLLSYFKFESLIQLKDIFIIEKYIIYTMCNLTNNCCLK